MTTLTVAGTALPPVTPDALEKIRAFEAKVREMPQFRWQIEHVLHGGMYSRTCRLLPGHLIVGVLIKVPTQLVVHGRAYVFTGEKWHKVEGFQVIAASAGRKQIFVALDETEITMIFATKAQTIREAEERFTDEFASLQTQCSEGDDLVTITGVGACQE